MARKVIVELSIAEADALALAVGNSLYSQEDADAILGNAASREAAFRAARKLNNATGAAKAARDHRPTAGTLVCDGKREKHWFAGGRACRRCGAPNPQYDPTALAAARLGR